MITIEQNESRVIIRVYVYQGQSTFDFVFDARYTWAASLLRSALRDVLGNSMRNLRSKAYEEGWRDAKKRAVKQKYFSEALP